MIHGKSKNKSRPVMRDPAYRRAFEKLEQALDRSRERNRACWDKIAAEKLTFARVRVFGCAAT